MLPTPITKEQILEELELTNILLEYCSPKDGLIWELNSTSTISEDTLAKVNHVETVNNGIVTKILSAKFLWGAMCHIHASKQDDLIALLRTYAGYTMCCNLNNY